MTKVDLTKEQKTQIILALDGYPPDSDHPKKYLDGIADKIARGARIRSDEARAVLSALAQRLAALSDAQQAAMEKDQIINTAEIAATSAAGAAIEKAYYADDGIRSHNSGGWAFLT